VILLDEIDKIGSREGNI